MTLSGAGNSQYFSLHILQKADEIAAEKNRATKAALNAELR